MDRSSRRRIENSRRNKTSTSAQEVNGNKQSGPNSIKVENSRRQKQSRDCYKVEDLDRGMGDVLPNYMPMHGQRLFAAVSDPAVCGYPVSLDYTYGHIPVSVGYPMYPPTAYPPRVPYNYKDPIRSPRRNRTRKHDDKFSQKDTFETVDEYTSLPPGNLQDIESDQQRRFSDPGLANNSGSEKEEDSLSNVSSASWCDDSQIAMQVETLLEENKRLSKELKDTQSELQELKLEVASLTQMQSSCEPGFISELVREVHEATKLREETLLARLRSFSENFQQSHTPSPSIDMKRECTKECEDTKEQLANVNLEKDELTKRLSRLEEQMKTILKHNSIEEKAKSDLLETQKEKRKLQEELQTAVDAKTVAEANANKYERLINSITKKLPNGLVLEDKGWSLESPESLTSSLGSGSLHSPQVTMSGPVTDL